MNVGQVIFDFVIPILLIIFGAYFRKYPIKQSSVLFGHRTPRAKQSDEAWEYAHKRLGPLWQRFGIILFGLIAISYFINPLSGSELNLFHFFLGVIFVFIPSFIIEGELKRKFGDPNKQKEGVQGLRQNKKVQKKVSQKKTSQNQSSQKKNSSKKSSKNNKNTRS